MTQQEINTYFASSLGQQCNVLFSTSDNRVFINYHEAHLHIEGKLDPNTKPLIDKTIIDWFPE